MNALRYLTLLCLLSAQAVQTAEFARLPGAGIEDSSFDPQDANAWADFDNDGDLDLYQALPGGNVRLHRNDGAMFSPVEIPGVTRNGMGSVAWFDWDNDGRLDLVHSGLGYDPVRDVQFVATDLWRNTENGLVLVGNSGLPDLLDGDVAVGDFDLDGRQDLLMAGYPSLDTPPAKGHIGLWRNTPEGFVQQTVPGLGEGDEASFAVADFDLDGRPDFAVAGRMLRPDGNLVLSAQLWRNTADGFQRVESFQPLGVMVGILTWGDVDRDGRPDLLLAGTGNDETGTFGGLARVWLNKPDGFSRMAIAGFTRDLGKTGFLFDQDNDGWLDLFASGSNSTEKTELWRGGPSGFARVAVSELPRLNVGTVTGADVDGDGRVDLFFGGFGGRGASVRSYAEVWRNLAATANTPPGAPSGLVVIPGGSGVGMKWTAAVDAQTPSQSLTYNLRVGRKPGGVDVVSPGSDPVSGFRRVPAHGNAGWRTEANLQLPPGTYFAAVQAIDANHVGGPFSQEIPFTVRPAVNLVRVGDRWRIEWAPLAAGWVLESAGSPADLEWTQEAEGTAGQWEWVESGAQRFFRLRQANSGNQPRGSEW